MNQIVILLISCARVVALHGFGQFLGNQTYGYYLELMLAFKIFIFCINVILCFTTYIKILKISSSQSSCRNAFLHHVEEVYTFPSCITKNFQTNYFRILNASMIVTRAKVDENFTYEF